MLESAMERHFNKRIRLLGGISIKLVPLVAGIPDRLVVLPGGRMKFVELKTSTGKLSGVQIHWHQRIRQLGHEVAVLYGIDEINAWCSAQGKAYDKKDGRRART